MKNGLIKKSIDASVEAKTKELTGALEYAARGIENLLKDMRQDMFVERRACSAAITLQVLAASAAKYAVTARICEAQLKTLKCMQEAANAEQKEENKEEKA